MKSLSEIDTVSKRASRAIGFEWGIAEEVGKNTRMLEMFGIPGIKNLNYYYKIKTKKVFEKLNLINKENNKSKFEYFPIIAGVSFLDQVKSLENLINNLENDSWLIAYIFWELNLIRELGFGFDFKKTNSNEELISHNIDNINYVIPKFIINKANKPTINAGVIAIPIK